MFNCITDEAELPFSRLQRGSKDCRVLTTYWHVEGFRQTSACKKCFLLTVSPCVIPDSPHSNKVTAGLLQNSHYMSHCTIKVQCFWILLDKVAQCKASSANKRSLRLLHTSHWQISDKCLFFWQLVLNFIWCLKFSVLVFFFFFCFAWFSGNVSIFVVHVFYPIPTDIYLYVLQSSVLVYNHIMQVVKKKKNRSILLSSYNCNIGEFCSPHFLLTLSWTDSLSY